MQMFPMKATLLIFTLYFSPDLYTLGYFQNIISFFSILNSVPVLTLLLVNKINLNVQKKAKPLCSHNISIHFK